MSGNPHLTKEARGSGHRQVVIGQRSPRALRLAWTGVLQPIPQRARPATGLAVRDEQRLAATVASRLFARFRTTQGYTNTDGSELRVVDAEHRACPRAAIGFGPIPPCYRIQPGSN
jgi:hypothetical protein